MGQRQMTKYHFECDFDRIFSLEGWAEVSLEWDADGELDNIEVERIEIAPDHDRHMKIQRGYVAVEETIPVGKLWETIRKQIVVHLHSDKIIDELIDAAAHQDNLPDNASGGWLMRKCKWQVV